MTTATSQRQPELTRQAVIVIGGGAGLILADSLERAAAAGPAFC